MSRSRRRLALAVTAASALSVPALATPVHAGSPAVTPGARAAASPGTAGLGDPYFPDYGNGGYNVSSYDIKIDYRPRDDRLRGVTTIRAKATQALSRFNLDLALKPSKVTVNGVRARISHKNTHELLVTPRRALARGAAMKVVVSYAGKPSATKVNGFTPWTRGNGGALAVGQPESAAWWFPSNDHPRDKARFTVAVTVPKGLEVLGNGTLLSHRTKGSSTTWRWRENTPMATYLAFFAAGQYAVTSTRAGGRPFVWAVPTTRSAARTRAAADLRRTPEVVAWASRLFGPYPFGEIGGVVTSAPLGYALETQTRPVYDLGFWGDGENPFVVVHENAHQWFGDSVSVRNWRDIWLNEGFATYAEWLWAEQREGITGQAMLEEYYDMLPAGDPFWRLRIGDPGPSRVFDSLVYDRGAMTLQALRNRIGDRAFFTVLKTWPAQHRNGTADIATFIGYAERISGQQLDDFFTAWLYTAAKPAATTANGLGALAGQRVSATQRDRAATLRGQLDRTHQRLAQG